MKPVTNDESGREAPTASRKPKGYTVLSGFPADRSFPITIKRRRYHQPWHRPTRAEQLPS